MKVDVKNLDCDFLAFSSHKMCGPTGVGVLYGKRELLEEMPPFNFGGEMIKEVFTKDASWNDLPWKFEGGTPNIADVIGLGVAIDYIEKIGTDNILKHDKKLMKYARQKISALPGVIIYGPSGGAENSGGILSFNIPGVHAHDVGTIVNEEGVAIRTGHHCAQPLMKRLGVSATARMSFYFYNTEEDVDKAFTALENVYKIFKVEEHAGLKKSKTAQTVNK